MTHNYNRFYLLMIEKHTHYALTLAGVLLMHVVPAICGDGVTHPACLSECLETKDIKVTLVQKRQNYCSDHKTRDTDIRSPKSVTIHPDGSKFYVNSLEGMRTVVFEVPTGKKIKLSIIGLMVRTRSCGLMKAAITHSRTSAGILGHSRGNQSNRLSPTKVNICG